MSGSAFLPTVWLNIQRLAAHTSLFLATHIRFSVCYRVVRAFPEAKLSSKLQLQMNENYEFSEHKRNWTES